jgi:hypothetical protein
VTSGAPPRAAAPRAGRLLAGVVAAGTVGAVLAAVAGARPACAQPPAPRAAVLRGGGGAPSARVVPLVRADVLAGSATAVHASAGAAAALGTYLRLDASVGAGPEFDHGETRATVHGELLARFVLDPFRASGRGVHAAGGLAWWSRSPHAVLVALVGVEGRPRSGWAPSIEVGLGRGVRVGLAARRAGRRR